MQPSKIQFKKQSRLTQIKKQDTPARLLCSLPLSDIGGDSGELNRMLENAAKVLRDNPEADLRITATAYHLVQPEDGIKRATRLAEHAKRLLILRYNISPRPLQHIRLQLR